MRFRINEQMQLSPDTAPLLAVFFDFPLAFTKDFQSRGINEALSSSQGQPEYALNRWRGQNRAEAVPVMKALLTHTMT